MYLTDYGETVFKHALFYFNGIVIGFECRCVDRWPVYRDRVHTIIYQRSVYYKRQGMPLLAPGKCIDDPVIDLYNDIRLYCLFIAVTVSKLNRYWPVTFGYQVKP